MSGEFSTNYIITLWKTTTHFELYFHTCDALFELCSHTNYYTLFTLVQYMLTFTTSAKKAWNSVKISVRAKLENNITRNENEFFVEYQWAFLANSFLKSILHIFIVFSTINLKKNQIQVGGLRYFFPNDFSFVFRLQTDSWPKNIS